MELVDTAPLQRGLSSTATLVAVLVSQTATKQTIETLSTKFEMDDVVFRTLLQSVGPGVAGLLIVANSEDGSVKRAIGTGITAAAATYLLEQPIRSVLDRAINHAVRDGHGDDVARTNRITGPHMNGWEMAKSPASQHEQL